MMASRCLLLTSLLMAIINLPTFAQDGSKDLRTGPQISSIRFEAQRRGWLLHIAGQSSLPPGTILDLQLEPTSADSSSKLPPAIQVSVLDDKSFKGVLSIRGLLLPGLYQLILRTAAKQPEWLNELPDKLVASFPARLGDEAAEKEARQRLQAWLKRAHDALRSLALQLERRAAWTLDCARKLKAPSKAVARLEQELRRETGPSSSFASSLETAALDLELFERRLVVNPYKKASDLLLYWHARLATRGQEAAQALADLNSGMPDAALSESPFPSLDAQLTKLLGEQPRAWELGPEALAESGLTEGQLYKSSNSNFQLLLPQDFTATPFLDQEELRLTGQDGRLRLIIRGPQKGATAFVSIVDAPPGELTGLVAIGGWETWSAYQRIALDALKLGLRHEFRAELPGADKAIQVHVLERHFRRSDGRLLVLRAQAPEDVWKDCVAAFEELIKEFSNVE